MAKKIGETEKNIIKKKPFWKKKWVWVLAVLILVGGGIGWGYWNKSRSNIETTKIERGEIKEELVLSGEIKADEYANLRFSGSGELGWIGVSEGDHVKKGQALARLDTTSLYAAYEQAVSDLRSAQATADNILDQVKDHDDDETWEMRDKRTKAEAARDRAYRAMTIAEENLRNGTLRAPFEGIVTNVKNPFTGINTMATEGQIEILNPETIYFEVMADQTEVIDIHEGDEVEIVLDSYPDETYDGKVKEIALTPETGEVGTVYRIKVQFLDQSFDGLRVGMTGDARFVLKKKEDALYVPNKFVNSDNGDKYVNLNSKNNKVKVQVGIEGEDNTEIMGEVKEGDVVYD